MKEEKEEIVLQKPKDKKRKCCHGWYLSIQIISNSINNQYFGHEVCSSILQVLSDFTWFLSFDFLAHSAPLFCHTLFATKLTVTLAPSWVLILFTIFSLPFLAGSWLSHPFVDPLSYFEFLPSASQTVSIFR